MLYEEEQAGFSSDSSCKKREWRKLVEVIFKHTTSIGIRKKLCQRYILNREEEEYQSSLGKVRIKHSWGYGSDKYKYEHDDLLRIANEHDMSLAQVRKVIDSELDKWWFKSDNKWKSQ